MKTSGPCFGLERPRPGDRTSNRRWDKCWVFASFARSADPEAAKSDSIEPVYFATFEPQVFFRKSACTFAPLLFVGESDCKHSSQVGTS